MNEAHHWNNPATRMITVRLEIGRGLARTHKTFSPSYLTHSSPQRIIAPFTNSTGIWERRWLMFETDTGSCGGFAGISDRFWCNVVGVGLWNADGVS